MKTYEADVYREGEWWMISIPEIDQLTQTRHEHNVELMARECIAVTSNVSLLSFGLTLRWQPLGWKGR